RQAGGRRRSRALGCSGPMGGERHEPPIIPGRPPVALTIPPLAACGSRRPPRNPPCKPVKWPAFRARARPLSGLSMRTHVCGVIVESLLGQSVPLCGWADVARDVGGLCFIDLRDHEGIVQVVAEPSDTEGNAEVIATAAGVGYEDCLRVTGTVRRRESVNPKIRTGQVEVVASAIEV